MAAPSPPRNRPTTGSPAKNSFVVLLVDDEPDMLITIKVLLEGSIPHTRVEAASSGAEALKVLGKETVDLVITDYRMPEMNGLEFLEKARDLSPRAPRVLLTSVQSDLAEALRSFAATHLVVRKPIDPQALVADCRRLLMPDPA